MRCSKCKAEIDEYDVTCPFCGHKTSELYVRDVSELRKKIKDSTPPINFFKIIQDLFCDRKDESSGVRLISLYVLAGIIAIVVVIWSLVQPMSWFSFSDSLTKLFDSFWLLFGLKPTRGRGDIRSFLTFLIVFPILIRYITGKDRSKDNKK